MVDRYKLENEFLKLEISSFGAELQSLKSKQSNREYLWNANPEFWGRSSPILFPIVGKVWNGAYRYKNQEYQLPQHGFARDSVFKLSSQTADQITFELEDDEETRKKYPFRFKLLISYKLDKNKIIVGWSVKNTDPHNSMYFQIGAHPAFYYWENSTNKLKGYLAFNPRDTLVSESVTSTGYLDTGKSYSLHLDNGVIPIEETTLYGNTWILENQNVKTLSLLTPNKEPFLKMIFDAPVLGIWSPGKDNCPFICLEPWYGRCDGTEFNGDFTQKEYMNYLAPQKDFHTSYSLEIMK